jgi:hypothetical protein
MSNLHPLVVCRDAAGFGGSCSTNDAPRWPMFRKHLLDPGANEAATVADVNKMAVWIL